MKENVQRSGRFLSGMVMPNIAVFIAWGFITALFIPTGWMPNETLAQMVAPMQRFLLPTLIAYTGGKMVYDVRGGVVGAAAAIGILAGTEDPMFIGAMIAGPLGGWWMVCLRGKYRQALKCWSITSRQEFLVHCLLSSDALQSNRFVSVSRMFW